MQEEIITLILFSIIILIITYGIFIITPESIKFGKTFCNNKGYEFHTANSYTIYCDGNSSDLIEFNKINGSWVEKVKKRL